MNDTVNVTNHNLQLKKFVDLIGNARNAHSITGRKFDKVIVEGSVRYFVARVDMADGVKAGDIFGAKSKLAPNPRWFFGNLENVEKWDWSGYHGVPVEDKTVMQVKGYGSYVHYKRITN